MREQQLTKRLRRLRAHPALWGDLGPHKEKQCEQLIDQTKKLLTPFWKRRQDRIREKHDDHMLFIWS